MGPIPPHGTQRPQKPQKSQKSDAGLRVPTGRIGRRGGRVGDDQRQKRDREDTAGKREQKEGSGNDHNGAGNVAGLQSGRVDARRSSYDQIAREVGYANRGTAHRVVAKALSERLADNIDELRAMEIARLDALQASIWERAMNGDLRAINTIRCIIATRCRLLGLHGTRKRHVAPFNLVMTEDDIARFEAAQEDQRAREDEESGNTREATGAEAATA